MPLTFPKAVRLTRTGEFLRIKNEGRSYPGRYMVVGVLKDVPNDPATQTGAPANGTANPPFNNKVGVITSRRIGGAVVRNRVRRRFRELLRLSQPAWQPGAWAVLIARHTAPKASFEELHREWLKLGRRSGFLRREAFPDAPPKPTDERGEASGTVPPDANVDKKKEEASPGMG